MNILLLSAGRRVELLRLFKETAQKMNLNAKIIASDISNTAPAIYFADGHETIPRIGEENYISSLIDICNKDDIAIVIPTIDTELKILSENKEIIENKTKAKVLISNQKVIEICRNKKKTGLFLKENGFNVPHEYSDEETILPAFIKPLDGSSSINAFKVNSKEELDFFKKYVKNPIIQEFVEGEEYSVDCFLDFESNIISVVPRLRIQTRGGEILKGRICKDPIIIEDVKRLLMVLKPVGQITIQCIKTKDTIKYIEINPRFGGGAPMSIKAGANSCEYIFRMLRGEKLSYHESYRDNITFLRFDDSIALDENFNIMI